METFFLCYWPFVWGIYRWQVNSPHKGQWRGGLMFSLICAWVNGWVDNGEAGDLRRNRAHYDVNVMICREICSHCVMSWRHDWVIKIMLEIPSSICERQGDLRGISRREIKKVGYTDALWLVHLEILGYFTFYADFLDIVVSIFYIARRTLYQSQYHT